MQPEDSEMETTATLLVVDDEENILSSLVRLFSDEDGFDVIAKSSATDALAILEDRPVDIIISDIIKFKSANNFIFTDGFIVIEFICSHIESKSIIYQIVYVFIS